VSRWQPGTRDRLESAALELFTEQGFANTTVPEITARAGLTTRTFFRHFADKREVLFAVEDGLPGVVASLMAEAPASATPVVLVAWGLDLVARTRFAGQWEHLRRRRTVIRTDKGLRERELRKLAVLSTAIADSFRSRGLDELTATLAGRYATTALATALDRWLDQDAERPLTDYVQDTLHALHALTADEGR
jgi:AcrR family transcriptional regulator